MSIFRSIYYSQAGASGGGGGAGAVSTLTGNTGGAVGPTANNINVVGSGTIAVAGNPGTSTLTISVTGSAFTWLLIGASQSLVAAEGYFCTSGGALLLTLPAVSVLGDTLQVCLDGATSWQIVQPNAASQIRLGTNETTLGVGGTLTSTSQGDMIELVCQTANARWVVVDSIGNITVV